VVIDVYSFGTVIFAVLTGLEPFPNVQHHSVLMDRVKRGRATPG
jgi:hypothetical protein